MLMWFIFSKTIDFLVKKKVIAIFFETYNSYDDLIS